MSKRQEQLRRIEEYKERFRKLTTEQLESRLSSGSLYKEAAIAYREVLAERGIDVREA